MTVDTAENSHLNGFAFVKGNDFIRNKIEVYINQENVTTDLAGLYLGKDKDFIDNYIPVIHNCGKSNSSQTYKGVLNNKSKAVFGSTCQ